MREMVELVAVETGEVEMIDFGTDELGMREWILEQNEERVAEGLDAADYRVVPADTRNCPAGPHSSTFHATTCLRDEWTWENLGQ